MCVKRVSVVVSPLDYEFCGQISSGTRIVHFQKTPLLSRLSSNEYTLCRLYLEEGKAARDRRWPTPLCAGLRNLRVLILHDPTTIRLWESFMLFFMSFQSHQ